MTRTQRQLTDEALRLLRRLRALGPDDRERRTVALRDLAEVMVDMREHFVTPEGDPDWSGRTFAYRELARELYAEAGFPHDQAQAVQAAVRYHVGNIVRQRLSVDELADHGLRDVGPKQRARLSRDAQSALMRSFRQSADPDVVRNVAAALHLLDRVAADRVAALTDGDREVVRALATAAAERARAVADTAAPR